MILFKTLSYNLIKDIYPELDINVKNDYIIIKVNQNNIGFFELQPLTKITSLLHTYIAKEYRNKHYSSRATKKLLEYVKENTRIHKLLGSIPVSVKQQQTVAEKIGARVCGIIKEGIVWDGELQDLLLFELTIKKGEI